VVIGWCEAGDATSAISSSVIARQAGGHSATTIPTGLDCAAATFAAIVAAMPGPERRPGPSPNGLAAVAPNPDDDQRCQQHPVSDQREPGRHHRIPVLGDDVAGVAVARHSGGTPDRGQGDSGEQLGQIRAPPLRIVGWSCLSSLVCSAVR
jgi:hypothetical protein